MGRSSLKSRGIFSRLTPLMAAPPPNLDTFANNTVSYASHDQHITTSDFPAEQKSFILFFKWRGIVLLTESSQNLTFTVLTTVGTWLLLVSCFIPNVTNFQFKFSISCIVVLEADLNILLTNSPLLYLMFVRSHTRQDNVIFLSSLEGIYTGHLDFL